jgi:deoxyribodipyrimidine photolyase-related protein
MNIILKDIYLIKKKIILHHSSMQYYKDLLEKNKYNIKYINYNENKRTIKNEIKNNEIYMIDPIDKIINNIEKEYDIEINIIESPNFLLNKEDYKEYRKKTDKFFFHFFYKWCKKKIDIIPNINSKDKENRKKFNDKIKIPIIPSNEEDKKYIKRGIEYVNKNFKNNYGTIEEFIYPVTHNTAKKWLKSFLKEKFKNFGPYQDSIVKDKNFLFHSILSSSINIGLLNPNDIIKEVKKYRNKVPINSYEGYIRQLFWREYQRYTYIYADFSNNYFGNNKKLKKEWYEGKLDIEPVDNSIKRAFKYGYLHHIERLMVIGNYMNLNEINPKEGYKWFMEFSIDSYDCLLPLIFLYDVNIHI